MKPQRKCLGCSTIKDKSELLRIVLSNGEPVIDTLQRMSGRGCYVCNDPKCLQTAIKKRAFSRALKAEISNEALGRCFNDR